MKVSVVSTVFNEQDTIETLLDSLISQTTTPHEIIIVDGGSNDGTGEVIEKYVKKNKHMRLYIESGGISHGRNFGIEKAQGEIIALIDAGCIAGTEWLGTITAPFKDLSIGLVAGFYKMTGRSVLQKAVAPFHGVPLRRFDHRNFMPSARSMAFRKSVWRAVGGFSENTIRAGEDTLFNYQILKKGISIVREPRALVEWEVPKSLTQIAKKFFLYAQGDAQSGIWWHPAQKLCTHNIKILSIFLRYVLFSSLLVLSFQSLFYFYLLICSLALYAFWSIWKMRSDVTDTKALLVVPFVQFLSDIMIMAGFASAFILKKN